jgi:hypothetical protein
MKRLWSFGSKGAIQGAKIAVSASRTREMPATRAS